MITKSRIEGEIIYITERVALSTNFLGTDLLEVVGVRSQLSR